MKTTSLSSLFLILPALVFGEISTSSISSKHASYDGNALVLKGKVELENIIGKMQSNFARLEKDGQEGPFTAIHLERDVVISLKDKGEIACEHARFDFINLKGILTPKSGEVIRFESGDSDELLSLASQGAEIDFSKDADSLSVEKIRALGPVHVAYGEQFTLTAKEATYFTPREHTTHMGSLIEKVLFLLPKGTITADGEDIDFSCEQMIWQPEDLILSLMGNVTLREEHIGTLTCDEQIEVRHRKEDGNWHLSTIEATGNTWLDYMSKTGGIHRIHCDGALSLDRDDLLLKLDGEGTKPIEYFHGTMKMSADNARVEYTDNDRMFIPKKFLLSGNIFLSSDETHEHPRCALAEAFTYVPKTDTMVLAAAPGEKVLFWDAEQELTISAKEVHITSNDVIKGVGNVRFSFTSAESELVKKLFPFYRPKGTR